MKQHAAEIKNNSKDQALLILTADQSQLKTVVLRVVGSSPGYELLHSVPPPFMIECVPCIYVSLKSDFSSVSPKLYKELNPHND